MRSVFGVRAGFLSFAFFLTTIRLHAASPAMPSVAHTALVTVAGIHGTFTAPPRGVPTGAMTGGALLGNGDLGVVIGGPPEHLEFDLGKADFFGVIRGGIMPVGSLALDIPALQGASYRMQQNIGPATVTGRFTAPNGANLAMTSWVAAGPNLAVIQLHNAGSQPLTVSSRLLDSFGTSGNVATYGQSAASTWLHVSPDTVPVTVGNRLHGGKPGPFQGQIADVQIFGASKMPLLTWMPDRQDAVTFTGDPQAGTEIGALRVPQRRFTISAWVNAAAATGREFLVAARSDPYSPRGYPFDRGVTLGLTDGKLSASLNTTTVTAPSPLPLHQWIRVSVTYDGRTMTIFADGQPQASTADFPTTDEVMGWDQSAIHFGDPQLPFDGCGPQGLMVQHIFGVPTALQAHSLTYTIPAGGTATVLLDAVSDHNTPDFVAAAHRLAARGDLASLTHLRRQHTAWWNAFWSRSFVTLDDPAVQDAWYGSLYDYACCSRPDSPPPGLWGNFITQRQMGWQGDYTLDYNAEAPPWAASASNHWALAENYETPLLQYLPRGRAIAQHNHAQGLLYYTHLIPPPGWDDDPSQFMGQKVALLFGCVDCAMRWRYTRDLAYAKRVYPLLRGAAEYWDHDLVLQNGLYVDLNDGADEFIDRDTEPATTLAFLRLVYPALLQISAALHRDAALRPQWQAILTHLSPLPVVPAATVDHVIGHPSSQTLQEILGAPVVQGKTVIRSAQIGTGFPNPMILKTDDQLTSTSAGMNPTQVIFPGWNIGLESAAADRKAALDTVTLAAQWEDYNNDCTFYPAAADAGYDPTMILQHLDRLIQHHSGPNFAFDTGGGGIEDVAIVPGTLAAMFLQSYQQNIHLFPNWPRTENAAFGDLPACGGFLISSQITQGKITDVRLRSTAGQPCRLVNPWPGQAVRMSVGPSAPSLLRGPLLRFSTRVGETILLQPAPQTR